MLGPMKGPLPLNLPPAALAGSTPACRVFELLYVGTSLKASHLRSKGLLNSNLRTPEGGAEALKAHIVPSRRLQEVRRAGTPCGLLD